MARITLRNGELDIAAPYDPEFVKLLKRTVPDQLRSWNRPLWTVHSKYKDEVIGLVIACYNAMPVIVNLEHIKAERRQETFRAEYIGRCKSGLLGSFSNVYDDRKWSVKITEEALRKYFEDSKRTRYEPEPTLYAVLGVVESATAAEIKTSFRRLSKQWHPDLCSEPNAQEMFIKINEANSILSDPMSRKKYDFALEISGPGVQEIDPFKDLNDALKRDRDDTWGYQPLLRCGTITGEGQNVLGRFTVDNIIKWDDITDDLGRMMVSTWQQNDDKPTFFWV